MDLPWIEKYRPTSLDEVIDNHQNVATLQRMLEQGSLLHLLFYGPPGTGKTSTILALARQLYGPQYRHFILELNASDERGIDTVRNKIPEFAKVSSRALRLIILDEADAMTTDAQNALRRVIEQYADKCRFCLICNDISAIIPGLQSRCAKLRFCNLNVLQLKNKLQLVVKQEQIKITPAGLAYLATIKNDFRMVLNTLQCLHVLGDPITPELINRYLGLISDQQFQQFLSTVKNQPVNQACQQIVRQFQQDRWSLESLITRLMNYLVDTNLSVARQSELINFLAQLESQIHTTNNQVLQIYALVIKLKVTLWSESENNV